MAEYATLADCTDGLLQVTAAHLTEASAEVDAVLRARGINPADITLPNAQLTSLAAAYACRFAARDGAMGEGDLMLGKEAAYARLCKERAANVSRESLGPVGQAGGYGTMEIGRG